MLNIKIILLKKLDSYLNPQFEKVYIRTLLFIGTICVSIKQILGIAEIKIPYDNSFITVTISNDTDIFLKIIGTICILGSMFFYYLYVSSNKYKRKVKIDNRFSKNDTLQSTLNNSIERELEKYIIFDIQNDVSNVYVIKGEEGVGKSILSFQITDKLKDEYIIKYFYSYEWTNISSVYSLLDIKNDDETEELKCLIILDGVNENKALNAAILLTSEESLKIINDKKIKILFTTRYLEDYSNYISAKWSNFETYELKRFNKNEFEKAIIKIDPEYDITRFPSELISIASIPRYLNIAFKLKSRLSHYENIKKETLYWESLKEQVEKNIDFRTKLNITSKEDIQFKLFDIAKSMTLNDNIVNINKDKLNKAFEKNYSEIRTQLKENRITVKQSYDDIELNFDIVVISYSFYLLKVLSDNNFFEELTIEELADKIKFKLEPYDNDKMANIPFIIFQLANEDLIKNDKFYSALLYLWLNNHNSNIHSYNFMLWAELQLKSYCNILDIVELKNESFDRDKLKNLMISILGIQWKESKGNDKKLSSYIQHIIEDDFSDEFRNEYILKKRALTILMYYPLDKFIDSFIIMYENIDNLNFEDKYWINHNLYKCINILFRFGYTEDVFEKLKEKKEYAIFAEYFHSKLLNKEMELTYKSPSYDSFEEYNNNNLVPLNDNIKGYASSKFSYLKYCACRKDISLNQKQINFIKSSIESILEYTEKKLHMSKTVEEYKVENLMPIISKIDSNYFIDINFRFLKKFLSFKEEAYILHKYDLLLLNENQKKFISTYIIENIDDLIKDDGIQKNYISHFINLLIELMLFTATKESLKIFFTYLIECDFSTIFTKNNPIDFYIKEIFGDELFIIINNKLKNIDSSSEQFDTLMIYLYILEKFDNELLINWSIKKLTDDKIKKDSKDFYKNIIVNSAPSKNFIKFYANENLKDYLYNSKSSEQGRPISHWIKREEHFLNDKTFEELLEMLPLDSIGNLLIHNKRYEDIDKWGDYLFKDFSRDILNDYYVTEVIEEYSKRNETKFLEYAVEYLTYINNLNIRNTIFFSFRKFEDDLIKLLVSIDFDKARKFYSRTKNSNHIINKFMLEVFDIKKYSDEKFIIFRKNYILSLKNDIEILNIVRLYHNTQGERELKIFINEWIKSNYSKDRLLAVSLITWFGNEYAIKELSKLINDDSHYVKYYASWSKEVCLQEKYSKEIYEEILLEDNLEKLSSKLHQIKPVLTPTCHYWVNELNKKYNIYDKNTLITKRIHISRFWNRIQDSSLKDEKKFEINKRKLSEYYLGEKIDNKLKQLLNL